MTPVRYDLHRAALASAPITRTQNRKAPEKTQGRHTGEMERSSKVLGTCLAASRAETKTQCSFFELIVVSARAMRHLLLKGLRARASFLLAVKYDNLLPTDVHLAQWAAGQAIYIYPVPSAILANDHYLTYSLPHLKQRISKAGDKDI
jgi:hypothetical protein